MVYILHMLQSVLRFCNKESDAFILLTAWVAVKFGIDAMSVIMKMAKISQHKAE